MPECTTCARAPYNKDSHVCKNCFGYTPLGKPIYNHWTKKMHTNADRIREMDDNELAEFLSTKLNDDFYECPDLTLQWLQQPAEEEQT